LYVLTAQHGRKEKNAMAIGKLVSIFLLDGIPDGRLVGEISNWTGKAFKIPRKLLKESSKREELTKAGVYFLFGKSEDNPDEDAVYIGEAEEAYKRLSQHQKLEFWNEAVVFISKDENLNKAHVKYLEAKLCEMASAVKRYKITNSTTPTCPAISESEQAVMTEFLTNLRILINTLGYKVLEPLADLKERQKDAYFIKAARGANGKAILTNEGVVVTEGSEIATSTVPSTPAALVKLRQKLIDQGVIQEADKKLIFTKDYLLPSPSTAAAIVMGRNANGWLEWKDKKGQSLKDKEEK
jgi:hypothetical protein